MNLDRTDAWTRITFGIVPLRDEERIRTLLRDFCSMLGRATNLLVQAHRAPTAAALGSAIEVGRVQLAWLSPTLLVAGRESAVPVVPLVSSVRAGIAAYHAVLFVPPDSPIQRAEDLRGKKVAWVADTSASGYVFSRISLAQRGLDPRTLFGSEEFHGSHANVVAAVTSGAADVGATFAVFEDGDPTRPLVRSGFDGTPARIVDVSGPIPADVIVAVASLPVGVRSKIAVALQHLARTPAAQEALTALFGVEGFAPFSLSSLQALRGMIVAGQKLGLGTDTPA